MTVVRGFGVVLASMTLFGIVGAAIGRWLGFAAPGYYQGVFRNGHDASFDPVQVGFGLGLTQGIAAGLFAGIAIVGALAWIEVTRERIREREMIRNESRQRQ